MADNFWDTITGLGESAYNYVTDVNFGDSDSQGTGLLEDIGSAFTTNGNIDGTKVASGIGALTSVLGSTGIIPQDSALAKFLGTGGPEKTGYQGKIPTYNASRMQVPGTFDPARRPGSGGQRYFTDVNFGGADTSGQAAALQAANLANPANMNRAGESLPAIRAAAAQAAQNTTNTQALAQGGIAGLNIGGNPRMAQMMAQPRYLSGSMDGMADTIPASIDGKDPAALSGGEFVIPADVVSGMGNGNSDAGAKNLYG